MQEEGKKEAYDNVDVLYEDNDVIFVKIYNLDAAKYFGPEYLSRRYSYYGRGDLFVIYDKDTNEQLVIHKPTQYDFNVLDKYEFDFDIKKIEKKYPQLMSKILEIMGKSDLYSVLLQIKNGVEIESYELERLDDLIYNVNYNEKKPGNSIIEFKFDDIDDFFKVFGLDDYEISFLSSLFGGYHSDLDFYSYDFSDNDWKEGYLMRDFNEKNIEKVKEILLFISPNIVTLEGDEFFIESSKILNDLFSGDVNDILEKYTYLRDKAASENAKEEISKDFTDPFISKGIYEIYPFFKFGTSVNVLINLFRIFPNKKTILELLKSLYENSDKGPYEEYRFEFSGDFDSQDFNNEVESVLDNILEKVESSEEFLDIKTYKEIYNDVLSKWGLNKTYRLPKNKNITFKIRNLDPKTNKLIVMYSDENYSQQLRKLSKDEFFNFLYHPELFGL
jgi:hypothetical protein